jgi:hypothetical protein
MYVRGASNTSISSISPCLVLFEVDFRETTRTRTRTLHPGLNITAFFAALIALDEDERKGLPIAWKRDMPPRCLPLVDLYRAMSPGHAEGTPDHRSDGGMKWPWGIRLRYPVHRCRPVHRGHFTGRPAMTHGLVIGKTCKSSSWTGAWTCVVARSAPKM